MIAATPRKRIEDARLSRPAAVRRSGVSRIDRVIDSPPDGIGNGAEVRLAAAPNVADSGKAKKKNAKT